MKSVVRGEPSAEAFAVRSIEVREVVLEEDDIFDQIVKSFEPDNVEGKVKGVGSLRGRDFKSEYIEEEEHIRMKEIPVSLERM